MKVGVPRGSLGLAYDDATSTLLGLTRPAPAGADDPAADDPTQVLARLGGRTTDALAWGQPVHLSRAHAPDRIGTDEYNRKLSQRRAETVKAYLESQRLDARRVEAVGRGKSDPVTTREDCKGFRGQRLIKCLAPDRRVEIEVVGLSTPAQ